MFIASRVISKNMKYVLPVFAALLLYVAEPCLEPMVCMADAGKYSAVIAAAWLFGVFGDAFLRET